MIKVDARRQGYLTPGHMLLRLARSPALPLYFWIGVIIGVLITTSAAALWFDVRYLLF
jgi:hypothetical protein